MKKGKPEPVDVLDRFQIVEGQIAWPELRDRLGTRWEEFGRYMEGQTATQYGAFECDVRAFLAGRETLD